MFNLFKKKPLCRHEFEFVDYSRVWGSILIEHKLYYLYQCTKCNETREVDEYENREFREMFNIKDGL